MGKIFSFQKKTPVYSSVDCGLWLALLGRGLAKLLLGYLALAAPLGWADLAKELSCPGLLTLSTLPAQEARVQWSPSERFALELEVPASGASSVSLYLTDTQRRQRLPLQAQIPSPYQVYRSEHWINSAAQFFPISWSPDEQFVLIQLLLSKNDNPKKLKEVALIFSSQSGELVAVPGFNMDYGYQINAVLFDRDFPHLSMALFRHQQYLGTSFETWNLRDSDYLGGGDVLGEERLTSIWRQHRESQAPGQVNSYRLQAQDFVERPLFLSPNGDYSVQLRPDLVGFEVVRLKSNPEGDSPLKRSKVTEMRLDVDPNKSDIHWLKNGKILVVHSGERAWYWNSETGHLETFAADDLIFHQEEMVVFIKSPDQLVVRAFHLEKMEPIPARSPTGPDAEDGGEYRPSP